MAIQLDAITTDITLEIDEEWIRIADFQKATDSFLGLIKEVSTHATTKGDTCDWTVKVYAGSVGIGVIGNDPIHSDYVRETLVSGIRQLAQGIRPAAFTDKAIEHSKALAQLFKKSILEPRVRIWSKRDQSVSMERKIAIQADHILAPAYEEEGSVDGILERIDAHGKLRFIVYDVLDERPVHCDVSEQDLQQALDHFQQRVEVMGKVKYRSDGRPVQIQATRILGFPKASEIPSLSQMRRLFSGGTP